MSKFNVGDKVVFCGTESIITAIQTGEEVFKKEVFKDDYHYTPNEAEKMMLWYSLKGGQGDGADVIEGYLECENNKHKKEKD